jgi:hypothetical protein
MQVDFESLYEQKHLNLLNEEEVNFIIKKNGIDTNKVSDGYHTFGELYDHRIGLFIMLCKFMQLFDEEYDIWKSKLHHDGVGYDGWFIMGIGQQKGGQISYHLPLSVWDETHFVTELETAPEWDGHTSADVLKRIKDL